MVSVYLVGCYAGISLPVIGIGVLSRLSGSLLANEVFAALIIVLALLALAATTKSARSPPATSPAR